jgi:hypothetical protein
VVERHHFDLDPKSHILVRIGGCKLLLVVNQDIDGKQKLQHVRECDQVPQDLLVKDSIEDSLNPENKDNDCPCDQNLIHDLNIVVYSEKEVVKQKDEDEVQHYTRLN